MQSTPEATKTLLRPDQLTAAREEIKSLEAKLHNPLIQDKGSVMKQLRQAVKLTEAQTPRPPENAEEEGRLVKRSNELLSEIVSAMCSQEEMRKAPPGAVDKFMRGENSPVMKSKIIEWKNIQLRLKPGERSAANLEVHRPRTSTLNMDNAQIPGKQFFMPATTSPSVMFSSEQIAWLRQVSPDLADSLALMSNEQRAMVKDHLSGIGVEAEKLEKPAKRGPGRPRKEVQE